MFINSGFVGHRVNTPLYSPKELQTLARQNGNSLTFTCVPPGSGQRIGLDRDADGLLNGDELISWEK